MNRIVDIESDGLHLAIYRGFLTVAKNGSEVGRIAIDDIGAVIVHAHGITWSNHVFVRLSERGIPVVLCAQNHAPVAIVAPLEGHHAQGARMRSQVAASRPLQKQLWAQVVAAKIRMQGQVILAVEQNGKTFEMLARKVRSGDPENVEAQAARKYWQLLFGPKFRRDKNGDGLNAMLNYGYTVLRAMVSRAICGSGLHPTLGIFHSNSYNAFALSDDLMEPFRPLIDMIVRNLSQAGKNKIDAETKYHLTSVSTFDLEGDEGTSPLTLHINRFVHSLATSFETGRAKLVFPSLPTKHELLGLAAPELLESEGS